MTIKKPGKVFIYIIYLIILLEITSRLYFKLKFNIPFFSSSDLIYIFYPELKNIIKNPPQKNDTTFDILILSGSVFHRHFGKIEYYLYQLVKSKKIKIYNLAKPGHTSLDSYFKYKFLNNYYFDAVIFYHGINESRLNNFPKSIFKNDYSHYDWYNALNFLMNMKLKFFSFPFFLKFIYLRFIKKFRPDKYTIEPLIPKKQFKFGKDLKSLQSFKNNFKKILNISICKKELLIGITFVYFIPENYSFEKFKAHKLAYEKHKCPIENWGDPMNVKKFIELVNQFLRRFHNDYRNFILCDLNKKFPLKKEYFDDICHLTDKGSFLFAKKLSIYTKNLKR